MLYVNDKRTANGDSVGGGFYQFIRNKLSLL